MKSLNQNYYSPIWNNHKLIYVPITITITNSLHKNDSKQKMEWRDGRRKKEFCLLEVIEEAVTFSHPFHQTDGR